MSRGRTAFQVIGSLGVLVGMTLAPGWGMLLDRHSSAHAVEDATVYTVVADGRLVAHSLATATPTGEWRLRVADAGAENAFGRHLLALAPDHGTLYVLSPGRDATAQLGAEPDRVMALDVASGRIRWNVALTDQRFRATSLDVGPVSGRLFLFGNRLETNLPPGAVPRDITPRDVAVSVLDPLAGDLTATWVLRRAEGHVWLVYQGAVTPDERSLYVSYHGPDTTGIDRFDLAADEVRRCPPSTRPGFGCIESHGGMAVYRNGLLLATGDTVVLHADLDGTMRGAIDTGLTGNHLMQFAVAGDTLYAVGDCGYVPGFAAVDLRGAGRLGPPIMDGEWNWVARLTPPTVLVLQQREMSRDDVPCGDRLAPGPGPTLAVASATGVVIVDAMTGMIAQRAELGSKLLDVLVLPNRGSP
jgi:hypothetical protein